MCVINFVVFINKLVFIWWLTEILDGGVDDVAAFQEEANHP
jgi:hypothetical protein